MRMGRDEERGGGVWGRGVKKKGGWKGEEGGEGRIIYKRYFDTFTL